MTKKRRMKRSIHINPEYGLEIAILQLAADDYREALIEQIEDRECLKTNKKVRRLERFFLSDWGQLLSSNNGELIIQRCRREVYEGGTA